MENKITKKCTFCRKVLPTQKPSRSSHCYSCSNIVRSLLRGERKRIVREVRELVLEWFNDEKTCSGKPHCVIEECDLCVNCLEELGEKIGEFGK